MSYFPQITICKAALGLPASLQLNLQCATWKWSSLRNAGQKTAEKQNEKTVIPRDGTLRRFM